MEKKKINLRFSVISLIIFFAAMSRLIPHPANFSPIGGVALFGAAYYSRRYWTFIIPVVSMWMSDLILNNVVYARYFNHFVWFYPGCYWTYGAFILIGLLGFVMLKKIRIKSIVLASLSASIIFFVVSNFGVWFSTGMYPKNLGGLVACYAAGVPFFKNTVLGDLFYSGALFGAFEWMQHKIPALQLQKA